MTNDVAPVGQETISPLIVEPSTQSNPTFLRTFDPIPTSGAEFPAPVGQETLSPLIVEPAANADPILEYDPLLLQQEFSENVITLDPILSRNPPNIPATPDFIQENPPGIPSGNPLPDWHLRRDPVPVRQEFSFKIAQIIPPNNPMGAPIDLVTYPYTTGIALPLTEPANLRQPTSQETISPLINNPPPPGAEPWPVQGVITQNTTLGNDVVTSPTLIATTPSQSTPYEVNDFTLQDMSAEEPGFKVNPTPPLDTGHPPYVGQKI